MMRWSPKRCRIGGLDDRERKSLLAAGPADLKEFGNNPRRAYELLFGMPGVASGEEAIPTPNLSQNSLVNQITCGRVAQCACFVFKIVDMII